MKVRIKKIPIEREIDGIDLSNYSPGSVREASPSVGSWLVAQGYADPEMRAPTRDDDNPFYSGPALPREIAHDRRKRSG